MPDSKITALASIGTGTDPVNDALVIVDVSDVSPGGMSATGTTKRVSLNNLLASSPTATLASATITGDLTVDTSTLYVSSSADKVGIGTTSLSNEKLTVAGNISANAWIGRSNISVPAGDCSIFRSADNTLGFGIASSTAMTLNATGLGVGGSPITKFFVQDAVLTGSGQIREQVIRAASDNANNSLNSLVGFTFSTSSAAYTAGSLVRSSGIYGINLDSSAFGRTMGLSFYTCAQDSAATERMRIDAAGQVGIGVTPSAWGATAKAIQIGSYSGIYNDVDFTVVVNNAFFNGTNNIYRNTAPASQYYQQAGSHVWRTAPSGTAGNTITYTQAMTLDASGNLLVGSALPVSGGRISGNSSTGPAGRFFSSAGDNQFAAMFDKSSATNTTSQFLIGFTINNQATGSGQINANGASQAAFGTFSDSRLKENIVSLPSQLANILSLRPVEFDYKDGSGHQIGFVAQEMQGVYSDTVSEQNGFLTVTGWSKTEARLVSAIKELAAKVQALEAKLA